MQQRDLLTGLDGLGILQTDSGFRVSTFLQGVSVLAALALWLRAVGVKGEGLSSVIGPGRGFEKNRYSGARLRVVGQRGAG